MANELTSLEAIAQKLEQIRKTDLEVILSQSGSSMQSKNDYGVTVVDDSNIATSLLFKTLNKDKYDVQELIKAVNTEVKELAPNIPTTNLDLVPRPLYNSEVSQSNDLRKRVKDLTTTVDSLNTTITTLETQVQTEINNRLGIEQSNDALANQLDIVSSTINDFAGQISTSLQKSVEESILRASLQSQNTGFKAQIEALIKQIDSLNAIIEGLQAQLGAVQQQQAIQQSTQNLAFAAGADVINKVVASKLNPKGVGSDPAIEGVINNKNGDNKWVSGNTLELTNNDTQPVDITISTTFTPNQRWLNVPKTSFSIAPGATETLNFTITSSGCSYGKRDHSTHYDGTLKITANRKDGTIGSKEYITRIDIKHPSSY
jgi:TolA-binding protein